jgi:hypothetical protein
MPTNATSAAPLPSSWNLDEIEARRIALETQTDVRSEKKVVAGGHVRGLPGARIHRALAERAAKELA